MNVAGIICEYNPLHAGHVRQMELTRKELGEDTAVVCVMSGNFTQRGECAIFEKHARAEAAVRCGADLVIELPFCKSIAAAGYFASGAVEALDALGVCTHLSFGSECGDLALLARCADALLSPEAERLTAARIGDGVPTAIARQQALTELVGSDAEALSSSNNALGIEYLMALRRCGSRLIPVTIRREGSVHGGHGSGGTIRAALLSGAGHGGSIPLDAWSIFQREIDAGRGPMGMDALETAIMAALRLRTDFSGLPGAGEGLGDRMKKAARSACCVQEVIEQTKSKRYTRSRVQRLLLCAFLGVTEDDVRAKPPFLNVLAMNQTGMALLRLAGERSSLPILTKPASVKKLNEQAVRAFSLQSAATDLYVLGYGEKAHRRGGQEWTTSPVVLP